MNDFERIKKILMLHTRNLNGAYFIIVSDNDKTIDRLVMDFSKQVSEELKHLNVVVFDYAKDIQAEKRYHTDILKSNYASFAMDYYLDDNDLKDEDLGSVVAIYRHLDNYILEGVSAEEKMQRIAQ